MRHAVAVLITGVAILAACSSGVANSTGTVTATTTSVARSDGIGASASASTTITQRATSTPAGSNADTVSTVAAATTLPASSTTTTSTATPSNTTTTTTTSTASPAGTAAVSTNSGRPTDARPFEVFVPKSYDSSIAAPLVVLLHGYGASGILQDAYFKLQPLAEERGFLYVHPDGTKDAIGRQFWNATDACCNFVAPQVDDSAYLTSLIDSVQARYHVDPKRIFLVGHSNGGFMSYRMACDHADKIAAIVSVAGATFADPTACKPSQPVSVLEIHGTSDGTIHYDGGDNIGNSYPGAATTVATWAAYNGCRAGAETSARKLDLEGKIAGAETSVSTFADCRPGGATELWTVEGGGHIPVLSPTFASDLIDFLYAHPKP